MLKNIIVCMRPRQWIKNVFVFAGLVFSKSFLDYGMVLRSVCAFLLYCLISGAVYLINDVVDREKDALHPRKKFRPVASGSLRAAHAIAAASVILVLTLSMAYLLDLRFFGVLCAYFILVCAYSLKLKRIIIVDVIALAAGFVLRTFGGTVVIDVKISPWLVVCTLLLALFLGLNKRRGELVALSENAAEHREILGEYTLPLIDHMLSVITSTALMSYSLYTFNAGRSYYMMATIPYVLYFFFRYQYLVQKKDMGESPEMVLLADKPLLVDVVLWVITSILIVSIWY